jgi:hypothetical protein
MIMILAPSQNVTAYTNPTHSSILDYAKTVLVNDGKVSDVNLLNTPTGDGKTFMDWVRKGILAADSVDLLGIHLYDPYKDESLAGESAAILIQSRFNKAIELWKAGDLAQSGYNLGLAIHLTQDATVPYHSHMNPTSGHGAYESWVNSNLNSILERNTPNHGIYGYSSATDYLKKNAFFSYDYYNDVLTGNNWKVANVTVPLAIQTTAGMVDLFNNVKNGSFISSFAWSSLIVGLILLFVGVMFLFGRILKWGIAGRIIGGVVVVVGIIAIFGVTV